LEEVKCADKNVAGFALKSPQKLPVKVSSSEYAVQDKDCCRTLHWHAFS